MGAPKRYMEHLNEEVAAGRANMNINSELSKSEANLNESTVFGRECSKI